MPFCLEDLPEDAAALPDPKAAEPALHLLKKIKVSADTITVTVNGCEALTASERSDAPFALSLIANF